MGKGKVAHYTPEMIVEMLEDFDNGVSMKQLRNKYGGALWKIRKVLTDNGRDPQKYVRNAHQMEHLDDEELERRKAEIRETWKLPGYVPQGHTVHEPKTARCVINEIVHPFAHGKPR